MRCLVCMAEGIPLNAERCPNPRCQDDLRRQMAGTLPPGTLLRNGSIRIEYPLGRGGFGITYLATHITSQQLVAVKEFYLKDISHRNLQTGMVEVAVSSRESFDTGLRKFEREGRILAQLNHPSIVQVRDLFAERGTAYLVMEYLRGETLKTHLTLAEQLPDGSVRMRFHALPVPEVKIIMDSLVEALAVLHSHNPPIVHLDIKPGNIILDKSNRVVLIDFGASRQGIANPNNNVSIMAYTPGYAPPELQGANPEYGPESDIFEMGMLLHEMLTGDLPPPPERRITMRPPWQPVTVPEPYRTQILQALEIDRVRRPSDIRSWWHGIKRQAAPLPTPTPTPKPVGLPLALLASGGIGITAVAAILFFLFFYHTPPGPDGRSPVTPVPTPTATPVNMATVCSETGLVATKLCPVKLVDPASVKACTVCDKHALYCKECKKVYARKNKEGLQQVYCDNPVHDGVDDPAFRENVLKLVEAEPAEQPEGFCKDGVPKK